MIKHSPFSWFAVYPSLIMIIFLVSGVCWCVSPRSFVRAHRFFFPENRFLNTERWESQVCSVSGRAVGAMFACFAIFMLYQLWIVGIH
jgi:hypothetical protein